MGKKNISKNETNENREPGSYDKGHFVYLIFLYFGITALLPFNAFITPGGFYETFYYYNKSFMNSISFGYNLPAVFMSLIMVVWGKSWPGIPRVMISLSLFFISLVLVPFVHIMFGIDEETARGDDVKNGTANDVVTILLVLLCGIANGIFFPTMVQIATLHGDVYSQAIMEGNGIGGIIPVVINIITLLCVSDVQLMAEIYFIIAAVFVAFAFILFFLLYKIEFSKNKVQKIAPLKCYSSYTQLPSASATAENDNSEKVETDMNENIVKKDELDATGGNLNKEQGIVDDADNSTNTATTTKGELSRTISSDLNDDISSTREMKEADNEKYKKKFSKRSTKTIFKILLLPELCVSFIFLVTLSLFPATALNMGFNEDISPDWRSIIVVGVFNVVDWVGRSLPKFKFINQRKCLTEPKLLFIYSMCRLVFIPLIVVPAVGIFTSTAYTVIMVVIFAITNGFISSMAMMKGPFLVDNDVERQIGGSLMTVMLNLGLTIGSCLNLAFAELPYRTDK